MPPKISRGFQYSSGTTVQRGGGETTVVAVTSSSSTSTTSLSSKTKEPTTPASNSSSKKSKSTTDISDRPDKRSRIDESSIERLNIESCWINTGNNTDNSDHTRLLKFFDNVAQYHMQSVQTLYPDQTYIENGIKSLYSLFLPSCRQYVADDAKIDQLTTNPKNEENKKKETSATNQIEKYKEELRQWENLSNLHSHIIPDYSHDNNNNNNDDDDDLDEETLKRYGLAKQLDTTITAAISTAVGKVDMITEAVRGTKRQLRATQKGTSVVSLQTRKLAFPDVPTDAKQTLRALIKTKATTPSTSSRSTTSAKKEINSNTESPIPNVLRRITQTNVTPSSTKRR